MSVKVRVRAVGSIDLADELEENFVPEAKKAVGEAADYFRSVTQRLLVKRRGPTPAPAGEPPAEQKGTLMRSIKVLPVRVRGRVVSSGIYTDDPGAARNEWGATDSRGIRTFPHPFLGPAAEQAEEGITQIIGRIIL